MKKTIILSLILSLCIIFTGCGKKAPDTYDMGADSFPSITYVVGDRTLESYEMDNEENPTQKILVYSGSEDGNTDIYEYMNYLIENCGGIVTRALENTEKGTSEIAMESKDSGKIISVNFDYTKDGYTVTIKKFEGKLNRASNHSSKLN
ncbi:MAG: hypothetical protein J5984_00475 [Clostridia bacterium]|nr:hypothetical protein [Clostridia bacterium]